MPTTPQISVPPLPGSTGVSPVRSLQKLPNSPTTSPNKNQLTPSQDGRAPMMKNLAFSAVATLVLTAAAITTPTARASTIITPPTGGIAYNNGISLGANDTGSVSGAVGQWSWQDPAIADAQVPNGGWGHTSHWIALTLTEPVVLSFSLTRNADVVRPLPTGFYPTDNYFPAFTIWQNWDTDPAPANFYDTDMAGTSGNYHVYPNTGNVAWAEDIAYLDHYRNSGTETSATDSWLLPAGNYTLAVGGLAPSSVGASRQGYLATFTTSAVPEPGSLMLAALTGLAALQRRRRPTK